MFNHYIVSDIKTSLTVPVYNISTKTIVKNLLKLTTRKKYGFTLAETLITLTVIGVIAAMTIPTLVTRHTKQTYVVGLKKAYTQLQQAVRMMPLVQNCSVGDYSCANLLTYTQQDYADLYKAVKVLDEKNFAKDKGCVELANFPCFYTADGMIISASRGVTGWYAAEDIYVDVNGPKGPNQKGRDQFLFKIVTHDIDSSGGPEHKLLPAGTVMPVGTKIQEEYSNYTEYYWNTDKSNPKCSSRNLSWFCTGRVLEENKMDY